MRSVSQSTINGLPGLKDLPIIGALFRDNNFTRGETELMIMASPEFSAHIAQMVRHFHIEQIKIFSPDGTVILLTIAWTSV
ncbi:hypothetical protein WCLP8_2080001 [uncultured Gammaproteobacteria bacterium]